MIAHPQRPIQVVVPAINQVPGYLGKVRNRQNRAATAFAIVVLCTCQVEAISEAMKAKLRLVMLCKLKLLAQLHNQRPCYGTLTTNAQLPGLFVTHALLPKSFVS